MNGKIEEIRKILQENPQKALVEINALPHVEKSKEALMLRADIFQALNKNTDAINDYIEILKSFGPDEEVENRKKFLETIVGMTQLDIFACTNLHKDPWE